ncbi:MAG TPA: tetratricopeptide repeat protein [Spirochaetia bacterium]|nr:tetratricopeptide repeat protein [Spirochaetia bacterium]
MKFSLERGIQFFSQKRFEQAKKEFLGLSERPEENPIIAYYLGLTYTKLREYQKAVPLLEYVILTHHNLFYIFQCRMVLGLIYSLTAQYQLAEMEFRNLIKLGIESPQVYTSLGFVLYGQGKSKEGIECLKKALVYKPNYSSALNNLGYIYAEEGINTSEAVSLIKKAQKSDPGNPVYLDSLGWAYYKNGNLVDAKAYLRKALDIAKSNKEIAAHLKRVLEDEKKGS